MGTLNSMSIRLRLVLLGAVLIMTAAAGNLFAYRNIESLHIIGKELTETQIPALRRMLLIDMMHDGLRAAAYRSIIAASNNDKVELSEAQKDLEEFKEIVAESTHDLDKLTISDEAHKALNEVRPDLDAYLKATADIISLAEKEGAVRARQELPNYIQYFDRLEDSLGKLGELIEKDAEKSMEGSDEEAQSARNATIAALGVSIVLCLFCNWLVSSSITEPMRRLAKTMNQIAEGDLSARGEVEGTDEVAQLSMAMNQTLEMLSEKIESLRTVLKELAQGRLNQQVPISGSDPLGQMGDDLRRTLESLQETLQTVMSSADTLTSTSTTLTGMSGTLLEGAERTSRDISSLAERASSSSHSVQVLAAATEEMGASIREIANSSLSAAKVAEQAVAVARDANERIQRLGKSSDEIGNMLKVITSIAQQTNLLALNATIEAARAGEAGKGFAVVANEVKELAKGTAKATEDIGCTIQSIQADIQGAVSSITQISQIVYQIHELQNTIAGAVEEQTATTNEMARNVTDAARDGATIAEQSQSVQAQAATSSREAGKVQDESRQLASMAQSLAEVVSRFDFGRGEGMREKGTVRRMRSSGSHHRMSA
ncbi:MAG: methyl-accepting chemotaxis protein [Myxococcota bacterium]